MTSTIKVNNIQNQCGQNIINENSNTITIGASGDTIALASGASQTGFGREGSVDWQTGSIKTTTFTAVSGEGYFVDTSSGGVTCNLPAGSAGAIVAFADYTRTFGSNNLTISPNGSEKIGGQASDTKLTVSGQAATFVYVDGTEGWINVQNAEDTETGLSNFLTATGGTITTCGDCKIHTFTGPGTFAVSTVGVVSANNQVSYAVVAGGGGGGKNRGGGGGAGGFREDKSPITPYTASPLEGAGTINVTETSFPIVVGGGGAGAPHCSSCGSTGTNGSDSSFSTITSTGGGGGGNRDNTQSGPGGSGGGAAGGSPGSDSGGTAGVGNTPPVSPIQGKNGGNNSPPSTPLNPGAGGGGAGQDGGNANPNTQPGGAGGNGVATLINPATGESGPGPSRYYAGGGGGGPNDPGPGGAPTPVIPAAAGGIGGGGDSGTGNPGTPGIPVRSGSNGTANTGGGGGGSSSPGTCSNGGSGGSGVVIIRYKFQ